MTAAFRRPPPVVRRRDRPRADGDARSAEGRRIQDVRGARPEDGAPSCQPVIIQEPRRRNRRRADEDGRAECVASTIVGERPRHRDAYAPPAGETGLTFPWERRPRDMRVIKTLIRACAGAALLWPQAAELKTTQAVLEKYQRALGGADAIRKVQCETRRGEVEGNAIQGKATFVAYTRPFKTLSRVTLPGGAEIVSGFDGSVSWSITPQGASIDKSSPVEAVRRDADLQYALHQADYFEKYELAGVFDFEGRRCYWVHGTTHWGKDNNQYYDIETGLLAGYRFQSDNSSSAVVTTLLFQEYKSFGGPLVATKNIARTGQETQTVTFTSVTYEPLADSLFDLPAAVRALLK